MHARVALFACVLAAALVSISARGLQRAEETGGVSAADQLSELARAAAGDYAPDPNAQIINDDNGGTSVVLSNQNSVHEQTDDTWKIHLVREAQKKTKEENKRKQALEEKRKQSYEEANKMDQEEEKHKKVVEENRRNQQNANNNNNQQQPADQKKEETPAGEPKTEASTKAEEKVSLMRTCTFSKDAACGSNFANKGLAGFILRKDQYEKNPFSEGGDFNQGWKWTHPYLCCPANEEASLNNMFVMAKACPAGTEDIGFIGALLLKKDYAGNPFAEGGDFNEGWKWTHPVLCKVSDYAKVQTQPDWCLFASSCPAGKWVDKSFGGVIVVNQHYDRQPFNAGGQFNPNWKWAHPKLCCRS